MQPNAHLRNRVNTSGIKWWFLVIAFVLVAVVMATRPVLLVVVLLLALLYSPLYLPFLLSFCFQGPQWRGLRWALRVGSIVATAIWAMGTSGRRNFGDDVAGNLAGAMHNFAWTWGSGVVCFVIAVSVGLVMHRHIRRPGVGPAME